MKGEVDDDSSLFDDDDELLVLLWWDERISRGGRGLKQCMGSLYS